MKTQELLSNPYSHNLESNFPAYQFDSLEAYEVRLKELWFEYISYLDQKGVDQFAKSLKRKYFDLYREYQKARDWRNVIG